MKPLWVGFVLLANVLASEGRLAYRIVNGTKAIITDYPFMVSVQRWSSDSKSHICGGTFISDVWILTAGHCVEDLEYNKPGIVRVESSFHASGGTFLTINRTVRHEDMRDTRIGIDYDFGLIKLNDKFERAVPVRLVAHNKRFPPGEFCTVIGWGLTKNTGDRDQLRMVRIPLISQEQCRENYFDLNPITWRMLCAGYAQGGRDSCEGDSGGPLLCRGIQVGITSWGLSCAKPKLNGVYSNIANQREWIRQHTGV